MNWPSWVSGPFSGVLLSVLQSAVLGADYMCISVLRSDTENGHACAMEQSLCVKKTIF